MSDPNMDAADSYTNWLVEIYDEMQNATSEALTDAKAYGVGYVRITWPGPKYDRVPPSRVLYMPDDPEIPE